MQEKENETGSGRKYVFEKEGIQGLCEALEDEDTHLRQMAALLLGETVSARVIASLVRALHDPDKRVRARAVDGLVKIGSDAVEMLIPALHDEDWRVRYRAAEALGRIDDERGLIPLSEALGDAKDHVRYMAAKSLGISGKKRSLDALIPLLSDENEYVRRSAAEAMGAIGGEKARRLLGDALLLEPDPDVRAAILAASQKASQTF